MDFRDLIPFGRDRRDVGTRGGDNPFESFQREMNRLFDDFFRGAGVGTSPARFGGAEGSFGGAATPRVDVSESDDAYEVTAELPGLEEKDVEVLLDRNLLTLKGEKRAEREEKGKDYHLTERTFGTFRRSIPLLAEVDQGKVEAHFRNGVLTVKLPKAERARSQAKRIEVRSA